MNQKNLKLQKFLIITLIAVTSILPALFIQLNEPTASLNFFKLMAKIGSLIATTLFAWQFLIGFRQAVAYLITDFIWTIELHKKLGIIASSLIVLHPVFITFFYLEKEGINPLTLTITNTNEIYYMLGQIALIIIAVIFITSVIYRQKMSFDSWYLTHLASYLLLPIALIHSFPIGSTLQNTPARYIWITMTVILAAFYIYRILCRLMIFSRKYKVIDTQKVAQQTTEIKMAPLQKPIKPQLSQFIYFRRGFWNIARPYTVSDFDDQANNLSITAKAMGRTSTALQSIEPGKETYIDGPYGVFATNILQGTRPVVMVAGGIGITPFRRVFNVLQHAPHRDFYLFYGNKNENEIAYKDEFQHSDNVKVIHVMSDQEDFPGEKGFINTALIEKYIKADLTEHEFFICGPPVMTMKLEQQLLEKEVPSKQIHHEMFTY